uniref:Putative ovule protein n=1 Tax=Solanum chacoense TaxID=4108 RepID=A0A0V0IPX8_SOLCH
MSRFDLESLQEMLCVQEQLIEKLYNELDEESEASSSAATEALSMILRLQGEKAAEEMEAEQYKRFVEEKMSHAEESLSVLQELIDQKQMEIDELDHHAQVFRNKLVSMGYDDDIDDSDLEYLEDLEGKMIVLSIGRCKSTPNIPLKYANMKKDVLKDEKISPKRDLNDVPTARSISLYCEQVEKLEERVKQIAGANYAKVSSLPVSKRSSCNNFLEQFKETYLVQHRGNKSDSEAATSRSASPPNVLDVFEVPRAIKDEDFVVRKEAQKQLVKDETDWHKKYLVPMPHLDICPTTSASETAEIHHVNRTTFEIAEVERQGTRQEPERHEELMLLHDIKEQPNLVPEQHFEICPATSASETEEIRCVNRTTFKKVEVERQGTRQEPDRHKELMLLHDIKEQLNLVPIKHLENCPMTNASETAEIRRVNKKFEIAEVERHGTRQIERHGTRQIERHGTRQETERHKELMLLHDIKEQLNLVPMQNENKLHRVGEAASPITSASETAEIRPVNRTTFEVAEVERQRTRQESNRHEELTLLYEIKEQLNLMQSDIKTWKNIKSHPRNEPSVVSLTEVMACFWL